MKYYLLQVVGDVEPELHGPFNSDDSRLAAAKVLRADDPQMENGLYRLNILPNDTAEVGAFGGIELG